MKTLPTVFLYILSAAFLLQAACIPSIDVTAYDRSCATADDCVGVIGGDLCAPCLCPNSAVHISEETRYNEELEEKLSQCIRVLPEADCLVCDPEVKAFCSQEGSCFFPLQGDTPDPS